MRANGEIDDAQKAKLAHEMKAVNDQIAGEYNRVDNKAYNWALNNVSFLTMIAALPLAAVSSLVETGLVVFNSPKPMETAWTLSKIAAKEFMAIGNETLNTLSNGRIPMRSYLHREQLRKAGYLLETQGAAVRVGAEGSPAQARFIQKFFKINMLTSLTNIQRATRIAMAEDAVESWVDQAVLQKGVNNRLYTEAYENLSLLGVDPEFMIKYKELYHGLEGSNLPADIREQQLKKLEASYNEQLEVAKGRFTDQAVAQPFKGNRPKFYNDPRLRMFTMFQGFISTFTANILPMLYGNLAGKNSLPATRVKTLQTMAAMIAFSFLAQNLKDFMKDKEEEEEKEFKDFLRVLYGSGLLGTGERPLTALFPLYGETTSATGRAVGDFIGRPFGDVVDAAISEAPALDYLDRGVDIFGDVVEDKTKNIGRKAASLTPLNVFKNWFAEYERE